MVGEMAVRFLLGGLVVSLFAGFAEMCQPKTFAGIFGAAPSVALVTLMLAYHKEGAPYVASEARSMVVGALGLAVYSSYCVASSKTQKIPVWLGAAIGWAIWLAVSFGIFELAASTGVLS
jgi:hypothetical protein